MTTLIKGLTIYTEDEVLTNASLGIDNGKIVTLNENFSAEQVIQCEANDMLLPGMIDMHIHGANNADTMDANAKALQTICTALAAEGTTSFLATTMSETIPNIDAALKATAEFCQTDYTGAEILGIHLEGPFISKKRIGAQREDCVLKPDIELFKKWQTISANLIKLVTIAPEEADALVLITYLVSQGIIASIGHTDADYQQALAGIEAGCSHATHLFNAMRGIHHRDPNAITALLNSDEVTAELIVDGVHLNPAIVELAYQTKTADKLVLITDAMRAKCCCDGEYSLGAQDVIVKGNEARLKSGALAGSVLKMTDAVKNMLQFSHCDIFDIIKMTSSNPAKLLNAFDHKGSIQIGKDADLIILDKEFNIQKTFCRGNMAYHAQS